MKTPPNPKIHCSRRSFLTLSTAAAAGFATGTSNNSPSTKQQNQKATEVATSGIPFPEYKSLNIATITMGEHLAG